jgi:hypothetical protein
MSRPRVFISHSAGGDDTAHALLTALEARLESEDFEVLLDERSITVGDSWESKIATWLDQCHAAVVLFTSKALASDYVKFEVSNLLHRWHRGGRDAGTFLLLPIVLETFTQQQLDDFYFYKHIRLWDVQRFGPGTADAIIDQIVTKLAPLKGMALESPGERLAGHVTAILKRIDDDGFLTWVAREIGVNTKGWPAAGVAPLVAGALVSTTMEHAWVAIGHLAQRLIDKQLIRQLFDLLMPCWVGPEAAQSLNEVTFKPPGQRCAVVNGRRLPFTPDAYLTRAKAQATFRGVVVPVVTKGLGLDVAGDLRRRVTEALERELKPNTLDEDDPETVASVLRNQPDATPVIVAMSLDVRHLPALVAVAKTQDLGKATFLALTDPAPADDDVPGLAVVHPRLPPDLEQRAFERYKTYSKQLT